MSIRQGNVQELFEAIRNGWWSWLKAAPLWCRYQDTGFVSLRLVDNLQVMGVSVCFEDEVQRHIEFDGSIPCLETWIIYRKNRP